MYNIIICADFSLWSVLFTDYLLNSQFVSYLTKLDLGGKRYAVRGKSGNQSCQILIVRRAFVSLKWVWIFQSIIDIILHVIGLVIGKLLRYNYNIIEKHYVCV